MVLTPNHVKNARLPALAIVLVAVHLLGGCSTLPNGREWGQDATFRPGWQAVRDSAVRAAKSPYTWAPLAGAALLQIDDWDSEVASWASENTPVFGSQQSARDASGILKDISAAAWLVTALATPGGDTSREWFAAKGKGLAVDATAILLTGGITSAVKNWSDRTRPDGSGNDSFPSGHSSSAATFATLAARNTQYLDLGVNYRRTLDFGYGVVAAGTAWARVEGGVHYPSDVLVGMALGHFVAAFINDAFMGLNDPANGSVDLSMSPQSLSIRFWRKF
jgi:membrane-associated phospholipid phosphatase